MAPQQPLPSGENEPEAAPPPEELQHQRLFRPLERLGHLDLEAVSEGWRTVAECAGGYLASATLQVGDRRVDARDSTQLESLRVTLDDVVTISAVGPDAEQAVAAILGRMESFEFFRRAIEASTSEARVTFVNRLGLHARAAAKIVHVAEQYQSAVFLCASLFDEPAVVDAKSILGLLMVPAWVGAEVTIRAVGPDAAEAVLNVTRLIASGFNEL